ncbi:MAG: ABC transporter ATP-binding protein [Thermodesulfobacteriota bacterium]|nr:ABC transporter ATP-binding protein [Thermodesulfobacteriota bacterium]
MIHLAGIEKKFLVGDETVHALSNVNITVHQGEYVAIMGPSGSGKSTLLNIVGLLDRPDKGVYSLSDLDTTELTDDQQASVRRHKIGFVFQFFHLVPRLTSAENVELPMILAGVDPAERKSRVRAALSSLGISDRTKHRPDQLSGGQRQRVAIARATIMQPDIILADEPTGNLDRTSGIEVIQILEDLHTKGMTLIMVTHDPDLGKRASRRVQLVDGKISTDTGDS